LLGSVEGTWEAAEDQQRAAWEMHVELVTRISIVGLGPEEGILREALSSLYSIFGSTREILRRYGPTLAKQRGGTISFGYLAVAVLNTVLRPLLAKWHPELASYEAARPATVSVAEHERSWPAAVELRTDLEKARRVLVEYADLLAEVAGVPALIIPAEARTARDA
jgi:hypothetical protein